MRPTRRHFLQTGGTVLAGATLASWQESVYGRADEVKSKNSRPHFAVVGCGGMGRAHGGSVSKLGELVAVCDVDRAHAEGYNESFAQGKAKIYGDHRKLLEQKDIDLVLCATPDHWHTRVAVDAMRAGKDVYCEKPLTLTIAEGRLLCKVAKETGRILQVGTQQRSDDKFQTAVALAHSGRLGKMLRAVVAIGAGAKGGPFKTATPPANLDWDRWLGQAPLVDFIPQRCHGSFRWWYDYSGGKMTDWGAHHVDIAQWAVASDLPGPRKFEILLNNHPVEFKNGWPTVQDRYNTAVNFQVKCTFANGVEMLICDKSDEFHFDNGIQFVCEKGSYFVTRGKLTGEPIEALKTNPLPADATAKLRGGRKMNGHMANFLEACGDRKLPISDVFSHHRHLTTCHLANIALRFNRALNWDPSAQQIVGDEQANAFQTRPQRKGYEVA